MVAYCRFDVLTRCYHPERGCSFVSALGEVAVCKHHPSFPDISKGRFVPRLGRGCGSVSFAVLRGSRFIVLRRHL